MGSVNKRDFFGVTAVALTLVTIIGFAAPVLAVNPSSQNYQISEIDFGSGGWRKENLVFNLAIGYPF